MRYIVAIPVYNEEKYVAKVLDRVLAQTKDVLVIDDGSTDSTPCLLPRWPVEVIRHATNRGYGRSLLDAFRWACVDGYDWIITMDCDEQHEPESIPAFVEAALRNDADVISGSRYTPDSIAAGAAPPNRRAINATLTREINERLGLNITDAFCGFKAYRVSAINRLDIDETGYAFPLQFWVQAAAAGLRISEIPVSLIYNDPNRTFGGPLDNDAVRLAHYRTVLDRELARCAERLPNRTTATCETCCTR